MPMPTLPVAVSYIDESPIAFDAVNFGIRFTVPDPPMVPPPPAATALWTKAVVAIWVLLVPAPAVGARGTPVKEGETRGALASSAPCKSP